VKVLETGRVVRIHEIRPGIWSMWVKAPDICSRAVPGQFLHVRVQPDSFTPLLRRPLSIGRVHADQLELVWRVVGEGTRQLALIDVGQDVDLLGPLGHGFSIDPTVKHAILVGGGLGFPPMVYLFESLLAAGVDSTLMLGVRDRDAIPLADDDPILEKAYIVTEIEQQGFRQGLVTLPTSEVLAQHRENGELGSVALYSCGPWGLVGALQRTVPRHELKLTEVSLEQQMGCGVGVCQGCAVVAEGGPTPYRLVCSDGPVFDLFAVEVPGAK